MANVKSKLCQSFLLAMFCAALLLQDVTGSRAGIAVNNHHIVNFKNNSKGSLVGSVVPMCSHNECRGCKYKCKAEQVPIDVNDPVNSAYYYRCVCHQ